MRNRTHLPSRTVFQQSFTGAKAVDWLTGVHSRGFHGSGLVATRSEAAALAQQVQIPKENLREVSSSLEASNRHLTRGSIVAET